MQDKNNRPGDAGNPASKQAGVDAAGAADGEGGSTGETINELKNQVMELTTRLENGAVSLKSISDVCTFRAVDFHAMITDIRQQQRDLSASSSIEPVPPPPPVADTRLPANLQLSAAHEQREPPSATGISAKPEFKSLAPGESSPPLHHEDRKGSLLQPHHPAGRF